MKICEINSSNILIEESQCDKIIMENNLEKMNKSSMDATIYSEVGPSSPNKSRFSLDFLTSHLDLNFLSTQISNAQDVTMQNSYHSGPGSSHNNLNPLIMYAKGFIKDYSEESIDEEYDLDRNILLNEQFLYQCRAATYMSYQKNLNIRMREMLIDWIMEVCCQLSFKRATFHLTVVLIDIYLSKNKDLKTKELQLLGVTCLIIAAKVEVSSNSLIDRKYKFRILKFFLIALIMHINQMKFCYMKSKFSDLLNGELCFRVWLSGLT